jgi:hypothetical protein
MVCSIPRLVVLGLALCVSGVAQAEPRVEFELVTESGFQQQNARAWLKILGELGVGVRIRETTGGEPVKVANVGTEASPHYNVVGVLTSNNQLVLKGGRFSAQDRAGISRWIAKLKDVGAHELTAKTGAFGLTAKQFAALHESLATKVTASTKDEPSRVVFERLTSGLGLQLSVDSEARAALTDDKVLDELQGVSSGTAIAAILRPLGLVLVPEKGAGNSVRLRVADSRSVKENWPIGWPPTKPPKETLPDFYKFLNVEIGETPLAEAISAIQGRLKVPMIIDQNSLARNRIDLATTKVSLPKMNTYYQRILDRLLNQAKMKAELRIDEADQPFVWITTLK